MASRDCSMTRGSFSHLSQNLGSSAFLKLISDWFVPGLERNAKRTRFPRYSLKRRSARRML